jgi:uncharacterized protein (TIGR02466 family)
MNVYQFQPIECILHTVKQETQLVTHKKVQDYLCLNADKLHSPYGEIVKTTYNKENRFIQKANLCELESEILDCAKYFLNHIGHNSDKPLRIISWLNVFDKEIMEQEHTHYKSIISGSYYVSSDNTSNSGNFYIPDQIPQRELNHALYNLNHNITQIDPIMGNMIIFESWVRHGVFPNKTDTTRISIAFNIDNGDI